VVRNPDAESRARSTAKSTERAEKAERAERAKHVEDIN
tara:strand:+ start:3828 stop:3941 length:114 start_codon:yes stop_codon:yes gene_type:complete